MVERQPPPARLRALKLIGFKSFAERTTVEFGAGISAVVGPNGSGKSNLADALRWTLGEQGRLLRTRRSEDVIFAGSSSRRATGMADVTLVIDNEDRLLPLDYGEVEIGRRLYRSGENEYLLNRQRIRLRDLSELLDTANLGDNAFLFIGQGMVDQALALRPEERRPLFEEAAGVRRHERRRRHAEAELAEAEANLERVHDVLGELRPQVRRLAAQAEQLEARRSAGLELAEALVAGARSRWIASSRIAAVEQRALDEAHARSDEEMAALRAAEEGAARHSRALGERAERERQLRRRVEEQRAQTIELRLVQARLQSDIEARLRDVQRLQAERATIEAGMDEARARLAEALPGGRSAAHDRLAALDAQLAEIEADLAAAGGPVDALREQHRQRRASLTAELERQQRRRTELDRELNDLRLRRETLATTQTETAQLRDEALRRLDAATAGEATAEAEAQATRAHHEEASARRLSASRALAEVEGRLAAARTRLAALGAAIEQSSDAGLEEAVRSLGGRLLSDGLEIDPALRPAVSAALGDSLRALAVSADSIARLRSDEGVLGRGVLYLAEAGAPVSRASADAVPAKVAAAAVALGGDRLSAAVRRDPQGHVTRLLGRCVWVPTLDDALGLRQVLAPGWRAVTTAGDVVDDEGIVRLAEGESLLDRRAAYEEQKQGVDRLEAQVAAAQQDLQQAQQAEQSAAAAWAAVRTTLDGARRERRAAEEGERSAQRRAETAQRELVWATTQLEHLTAEAEALDAAITAAGDRLAEMSGDKPMPDRRGEELDRRRRQLLDERGKVAAEAQRADEQQRRTEEARRRAEIALAMAEPRSLEIDAQLEQLAAREQEQVTQAERLAAELATAAEADERANSELEVVLGEEAQDRRLLIEAERAATDARERLRRAEARSRAAEVAVMEARLHLEQVREQLLVELAAIGGDGLTALRRAVGDEQESTDLAADVLGTELESALEAAIERWRSANQDPEPAPGTGRLAALRRRFHELGAGNPFAIEEYAEVRARLETMEAQRVDLESAIANTRELIANLSSLITEQFLSTFAALEGAFARRFEQLFGGGEAQLSLTNPDDLSSTGVEITARPPDKKRQPLAMLSGGERALTAVALLLAMLEVRPVPFCVLDEVDAALDEANIGRFSSALRGLADRIQFIIITHNRGTIEAADALYGVTIGDDAVSRIVSLRLPPPGTNGHENGRPLAEIPVVADGASAEAAATAAETAGT
jgi:chromosome segregation protein